MAIRASVRGLLARTGRGMTLRRRVAASQAFVDVQTVGVLRSFAPNELVGGVMQGDARVILDAAPVVALASMLDLNFRDGIYRARPAFGAPRVGDFVVVDGRSWSVQGVHARMDGDELAAYELWVRGG